MHYDENKINRERNEDSFQMEIFTEVIYVL